MKTGMVDRSHPMVDILRTDRRDDIERETDTGEPVTWHRPHSNVGVGVMQ